MSWKLSKTSAGVTVKVEELHIPKERLARKYKPIEKSRITTSYPCGVSSLIPSLHDVQHYQGIFNNRNNFAKITRCEIFELGKDRGVWRDDVDEDSLTMYLDNCNTTTESTPLRAIFCTLENAAETTFGHRILMTAANTKRLLTQFHVSPQFVPHLLAEPDYWAPGDFATYSDDGDPERIEFFCQQPRWNIHLRETPWCIYMTYDRKLRSTTYIVVCSNNDPSSVTVKARLRASFCEASEAMVSKSHTQDPFLLHCMITHEAFMEAKSVITKLRHRLYDQLDHVDEYAQNSIHRKTLEKITIELHTISQDTDSLLASADMAEMITTKLLVAHHRFERLQETNVTKDRRSKMTDSLLYLQASVQAQKRWLLALKSRKDIAMNLVFNLVTQQDSATTTVIARETKADSASMKTIAALTMVFLPGTFMSSIFGMNAVEGVPWWVYVAITLPLTVLVVMTWYFWNKYPILLWVKEGVHERVRSVRSRKSIEQECKV